MPTGGSPSFGEFASSWLTTWAAVRLKASGYREYETIVRRHLLPAFGSLALVDVSMTAIQNWVAEAVGESSSRSVRNRLIVLKKVMEAATDQGLLSENPVDLVAWPRIEPRDMLYLTPSQIGQLMEAVAPSWRLLVAFSVLGGLRKGEVLALEWSDVADDGESLSVSVTKSLRGGVVSTPKTVSSVSRVALPASMRPLVEQRRQEAGKHRLIFCRSDGRPLPDSVPNRILTRALASAGLPHVRWHDLRRSWAISHIVSGTDVRTLAALGRWSSSSTLLEVYAAFLPEVGVQAVRRVDQLVNRQL